MKTLGVMANCGKPNAAEALLRLSQKAHALGLRLLASGDTAKWLKGAETPAPAAARIEPEPDSE